MIISTAKNKPSAAWLTPAAAFFITAAVWTAALAVFGMAPFGTKSIMITDMGQQYLEYYTAFYDAVKNGSSLLFTWNTGLGMNFLGIYAYYLASPFTWLIFLFPRAAIANAILLIISLKLAASALTFSIFLRRAADVSGAANVLFSVLYALSSYSVIYFFNLMWLDAVVLLPLVILAVRHLVNTCRMVPLVAVLILLFLSNFYTSYMVGLFSFLVLIALLWLHACSFRECRRIAGRFFGSAALAAGLSAFLLLPTFLALKDSQGAMGFGFPYLALTTDPLTLLGKLMWGSYDSVKSFGTPNIYCGILTLGLVPVWFLHGGISRREKIAGCSMMALLVVCMLIDPLDVLWHACEIPVWFPCRYSFVLIFTFLTLAARALTRQSGLDFRRLLWGFGFATVLMLAIKLPEWLFPKVCHTISGQFWITLGILGIYTLLLLAFLQKRRWLKTVGIVLLALCLPAELLGNTVSTLKSLDKELEFATEDSYNSYMQRGNAITSVLKDADGKTDAKSDTDFYRVENTDSRNPNDGFLTGYHSISHYSSLSHRCTFGFLGNCGMVCTSGNKILRYYGHTYALDTILGLRYLFSSQDFLSGYTKTDSSTDGLSLYRNENALPLAYFADKAVLNTPSSGHSPFDFQNAFLSSLGGQTAEYYTPLTISASCTGGVLDETDGERTSILVKNEATLTFTISNPQYQNVLLHFSSNLPDNSAVLVNGDLLNPNGSWMIRGVIDLGEQPAGDITVSIPVYNNGYWFSDLCAATFNENNFGALTDSLKKNVPQKLTVSQIGGGRAQVTGSFTAPRDGVLFTSISADSGWAAMIDGKELTPVSVGDAFLALKVSKGEHTFTLTFCPSGLDAGIWITFCTLLLCILLWLQKRRKERRIYGIRKEGSL